MLLERMGNKKVDAVKTKNVNLVIIKGHHGEPVTIEELGDSKVLCKEHMLSKDTKHNNPISNALLVADVFASPQLANIRKSDVERLYVIDVADIAEYRNIIDRELTDAFSRRSLFKSGLGGLATLATLISGKGNEKLISVAPATYALYEARTILAFELQKNKFENDFIYFLLNEKLPLTLRVRNLIMSIQLEMISRKESQEREERGEDGLEKISVAIGGAHGELAKLFDTPVKERLEALRIILNSFVPEVFSVDQVNEIVEDIFKIPRIDVKNKKITIEDLKI